MSIIKRLPWLSLGLVLLTYSVFGWILSQKNLPIFLWVLIIIGGLFLIAALTTPWSKTTKYFHFLFNTKLKNFGLAVLGAFLFFLIFARFRIFLNILLMFSATLLVRLDLQIARFKQIQAFCFTSVFSITGLILGFLLHQLSLLIGNW
ncbi:MAG: hypothetical protein HC836_27555 [Richelia sp. RM2_1_2]|nr:hypothetical protein [Richelia sp. SM2_1_7]NJM22109.1 hypothetical protein [Richelia sp. SM1_7_0]NJN12624.1 hypothetical protein [Richelia sp. RM1_1_1]NJO27756.1 hypothetical protein [Richelia sp. SL_2_1]NJO61861.1 hypothetical protein [Richelia sp. RM2_1_2]